MHFFLIPHRGRHHGRRGVGLVSDGPSTGVPAIAGKQPGADFFRKRRQCARISSSRTGLALRRGLATLAALDVNHIRRLSMR